MSYEPILGSLMPVGFSFAPKGWATCNGQLLPINQNQALFALLGTTYGGNGVTTFALPDLRGRAPIGAGKLDGTGTNYVLGEVGGVEAVALLTAQLPSHTHTLAASGSQATTSSPAGAVLAAGGGLRFSGAAGSTMAAAASGSAGSGQPHENRAPSLALTWVIALQGIFPSRN
ncbi:phage tail protein [Nocardioides sp. GXZ039]|uniref:phage tail protein n=1 Tax=Nocardioides sp. GXZ039 TaxID=3136018 RepID=UPI0030F39D04